MTYKLLKNLIQVTANKYPDTDLTIPTYQYFNGEQIKRAKKRFNGYKIKFIRSDAPYYPNTLKMIKR